MVQFQKVVSFIYECTVLYWLTNDKRGIPECGCALVHHASCLKASLSPSVTGKCIGCHGSRPEEPYGSLFSAYNKDANHPSAASSAKKMPPIPLSPLLHHLHNLFKRLWIFGDKFWKLGIRQVSFLQTFFRRCLSLIIDWFMSKSCRSRPPRLYDKADHHSRAGPFNNVDCFRKFPILSFGRWQRSHPDPETPSSTSQAVVPYSTMPMPMARAQDDMNMSESTRNNSTCSSTTRAEDNYNRDPPGLSKEISNFQVVGVTSTEFERYERNFTSYVLTAVSLTVMKITNPP